MERDLRSTTSLFEKSGDLVHMLPPSLTEVLSILAEEKGKAKILAGGTDLLPLMFSRQVQLDKLLSLKMIEELHGIENEEKFITVGATSRLSEVEESPILKGMIPILPSAISEMGSWQIRNRGTVGGNLCNASPAADTAAPLLVLDSEVVLQSTQGERRIPLADFFVGPGQTALRGDEILEKIMIPKPPAGGDGVYIKLGRRRAMEIAIAGVAVWVLPEISEQRVKEIRIALSSAGPVPFRAYEAESRLKGERIEEKAIEEAAEIAARLSRPITDVRGTKEYRTEMVRVLTKRAILQALDKTAGDHL